MLKTIFVVGLLSVMVLPNLQANTLDDMLTLYKEQGAGPFNAKNGEKMWFTDYPDPDKPGKLRNCSSCHGKDLAKSGKHAKTGKVIDPLALSVNSERFTKKKTIKKWFKRNCKWVLQRQCTAQEKGDFLMYLREQ